MVYSIYIAWFVGGYYGSHYGACMCYLFLCLSSGNKGHPARGGKLPVFEFLCGHDKFVSCGSEGIPIKRPYLREKNHRNRFVRTLYCSKQTANKLNQHCE